MKALGLKNAGKTLLALSLMGAMAGAAQADEALYRAKHAGRNRVQCARQSKQSATFSSEQTETVITL